jgi:hypothetical protein
LFGKLAGPKSFILRCSLEKIYVKKECNNINLHVNRESDEEKEDNDVKEKNVINEVGPEPNKVN